MDAKIIRLGDVEEHEAAGEQIAKGRVILHQQQAAIAVNDIEVGRKGAVMTTGVIRVRKAEAGAGFRHGDACDWSIAGRHIVADGDFTLGAVIGDVGRADTVTDVVLNGGVESKKNKPRRRRVAEKREPPITPMAADAVEPVRPGAGMSSSDAGERIENREVEDAARRAAEARRICKEN